MGEEGIDTGGKIGVSRKLVAGIIVAAVVIACIGLILWKYQSTDVDILQSPTVVLYISTSDNNYSAIIEKIDMHVQMNITEWTNIDKLTYLITNGSVNGSVEYSLLRSIQHNESNVYNIASGNLTEALNNSENNIVFYDMDNDGLLSRNDSFIIKGITSLKMREAISETGWVRLYIIFEGEYGQTQNLWVVLGCGQINGG